MSVTSKKRIPRIGFHAPITGGLHEALIVARDTGCDTVQIFSRNPRGWMAKPLSLADITLFKKTRRLTRINPVVIHCNYLVNLAAADELMLEKSRTSFREEIKRAILLGVDYLVVREKDLARLRRTVGPTWRGVAGMTFRRSLGRTIASL